MAMVRVPDAGGDAVPGGYGAPTPRANVVEHHEYEAPSSLPSGNPAPPSVTGLECIDGLGEATML
jgi:hypothetical protein